MIRNRGIKANIPVLGGGGAALNKSSNSLAFNLTFSSSRVSHTVFSTLLGLIFVQSNCFIFCDGLMVGLGLRLGPAGFFIMPGGGGGPPLPPGGGGGPGGGGPPPGGGGGGGPPPTGAGGPPPGGGGGPGGGGPPPTGASGGGNGGPPVAPPASSTEIF